MLALPGSPPVLLSAAGGQGQGQSDDWERAAPVARPAATSSNAAILIVLMASVPIVEPGATSRRQRLGSSTGDSRLLGTHRRPAPKPPETAGHGPSSETELPPLSRPNRAAKVKWRAGVGDGPRKQQ